MSIPVYMYIEDIDTAMDTYNQIKLYRSTTPDGTFSTLVSTVTLVVDTRDYSATDTGGTADSYYRYYLYHSTNLTQSDWSPVFKPVGSTLAAIRRTGAQKAGLGFSGTCSGNGSSTTLVDAKLLDNGADTHYLRGGWLYRPAATTGDLLRRITSFNTSTGALTVSRAYSVNPAADEAYEVYMLFPPYIVPGTAYSWATAIQDALESCWIYDEVTIGEGNGDDREFTVTKNLGLMLPQTNGPVYLRTFEDDYGTGDLVREVDLTKRGNFVTWRLNGPGNWKVRLPYPPATSEYIVVEAQRRFQPVYASGDTTDAPLKLAAYATAWQALRQADQLEEGKYATALDRVHRDFIAEMSLWTREQLLVSG